MNMSAYTLKLEHPDLTTEEVVYSDSEVTLRLLGRDHHRAAIIKPDLTLIDPEGKTLATMDAWALDWAEV